MEASPGVGGYSVVGLGIMSSEMFSCVFSILPVFRILPAFSPGISLGSDVQQCDSDLI